MSLNGEGVLFQVSFIKLRGVMFMAPAYCLQAQSQLYRPCDHCQQACTHAHICACNTGGCQFAVKPVI